MNQLEKCPICNSMEFLPYISCTDYTVSQKGFSIVCCSGCGFKFTNPRPEKEEIGSYYKSEEYISHSDTKTGIINRLYHIVRKYTLIKKLQLVSRILGRHSSSEKVNLLDIGCGTGAFLDMCKRANFNCVGIEPDSMARKAAELKYNLDVRETAELKNLKSNSFDIITLWHVLEHISDLDDTIQQIKRLIKHDGRVVIALPNCDSYDAKFYDKYWAAYDLPRHLYHFTPTSVKTLCEMHKLKIVSIQPMIFDSFYVSLLSEKYKHGKNNFFMGLLIGLTSNIFAIKTGKTYSSLIYIISNEQKVPRETL